MSARCTVVAGVVALGAGLVSGTTAVAPGGRAASVEYGLAAATSSLLNVPVNLFNLVLSIPAWEVRAMDRLADAMIATGSWQVWGPTNVVGFDELDPPKLQAAIDMLMPVEPFSSVLGANLSWQVAANLPMSAGCAANPGACPDMAALWRGWNTVPARALRAGYQFPAVVNPFTLQPTSWSGKLVKLDREPLAALWDYLSATPAGAQTAPLEDYVNIPAKLARAIADAFYPFVQDSEWFNSDQTLLAPVFRALAPITCPSCEPGKPFDNPWLYENYPPKAATPAAAVALADQADPVAGPGGAEPAEPADLNPAAEPAGANPVAERADPSPAVSAPPERPGAESPASARASRAGQRRGEPGADRRGEPGGDHGTRGPRPPSRSGGDGKPSA